MGQFVPLVELGLKDPQHPDAKRQSIRNFRRRPIKPGERIVLYFAQRSKWCRRLGEANCMNRFIVQITHKWVKIYTHRHEWQQNQPWHEMDKASAMKELRKLRLLEHYKSDEDLNRFAKADGFKDWETMKRWWTLTHGPDALPYIGNLYMW